jgi:hypothetical protein
MQAQQRYRERRKQKFNEMEQSLHLLARQVEQMSTVQSQNSMLQVRSMYALPSCHSKIPLQSLLSSSHPDCHYQPK